MWLLRFRLRVRTLLWLVALTALGLFGYRIYEDDPQAHWLCLKLRFGNVAMRRAATLRARDWGAEVMIQDVRALTVAGAAPPPQKLEAERRYRQRGAKLLFPAFVAATRDPDPRCRADSLSALDNLACLLKSDAAKKMFFCQVLIAARDRDDRVRMRVVSLLSQFVKQDNAVVLETLRAALSDPSVEIREAATKELGWLGTIFPERWSDVSSILIPVLKRQDELRVRLAALQSLASVGVESCRKTLGPDVVPALVAALQDPMVEMRREAARSFQRIDEDAQGGRTWSWAPRRAVIVPALKQAVYDDDENVSTRALLILSLSGDDLSSTSRARANRHRATQNNLNGNGDSGLAALKPIAELVCPDPARDITPTARQNRAEEK